MAFHVEIRQTRRHARIFNLDEAELRRAVIDPWQLGGPLELGGRSWERRDARLRILEGPTLESADLAFGQGWNRAQRDARDVTDSLLAGDAGSTVAVIASDPDTAELVAELLRGLGLEPVAWAPARRRVLAWVSDPGHAEPLPIAAALLVCAADPPAAWLLDAGLALGALGARVIAVQIDGRLAPELLRDVEVLALDPQAPSEVAALARRLQRVGCAASA
jgi:hypothetical protein